MPVAPDRWIAAGMKDRHDNELLGFETKVDGIGETPHPDTTYISPNHGETLRHLTCDRDSRLNRPDKFTA
jgi:hypothetical protein